MKLSRMLTGVEQLNAQRRTALEKLFEEYQQKWSLVKPEAERVGFSSLYLTGRCHLHCIHCHAEEEFAELGSTDAPTEQIIAIMNRLAVISDKLQYTGGETFTRVDPASKQNDLLLLLAEAARRKVEVIVQTTGMHLTEEIIEWIAGLGNVNWFSISLDGHDPASNSILRQNDESFAKSIAGIKLVKKYGFKLKIGTCLTALNSNLEEVRKTGQLVASLGADNWKLMQFYGREVGRSSGLNSDLLHLPDTEFEAVFAAVSSELASAIPRITSHNLDVFSNAPAVLVQPNGLVTTLKGTEDVVMGNILVEDPIRILEKFHQSGFLTTVNINDKKTY